MAGRSASRHGRCTEYSCRGSCVVASIAVFGETSHWGRTRDPAAASLANLVQCTWGMVPDALRSASHRVVVVGAAQ